MKDESNFERYFILMLTTFVIICAIIPSILLYSTYSKYEKGTWEAFEKAINSSEEASKNNVSDEGYLYLLDAVRPAFNDLIKATGGYSYVRVDDGISLFKTSDLYILITVLIAIILIVFTVVRKAIPFYFLWNIFTNVNTISHSDDEYLTSLQNKEAIKGVRIFAVTASAYDHLKFKAITYKIDLQGIKSENDFADIKSSLHLAKSSDIITLVNFGYNPDDLECWNKKLELLEEICANYENIAIESSHRIIQVFSRYEKALAEINLNQTQIDKLTSIVTRWRSSLQGFIKIFLTQERKVSNLNDYMSFKSADECLKKSIEYERTAWRKYFEWTKEYEKSLDSLITQNIFKGKEKISLKQLSILEDEIILKIQSMAQPFYFSIWNNCSKTEKFLLYDLARDGFVNPKAFRGLYLLLEKGLIYRDSDNRLLIRNRSFQNFILTNIRKSEATEINRRVKESGTYNITKSTVFLVLLASLVFIGFTNQDHLDALLAIITGLAAALPLFLNLLGLGSNSSK